MGDGRQQDGDFPEEVRRQDGGGARNSLPHSEAARGNENAKPAGGESRSITRAVESGGRTFAIEETSGTAAAETSGADRHTDGTDVDTPLQADGRGGPVVREDGVGQSRVKGREDPGESGGGAYPNPHSGKASKNDPADFLGHGGQTEQAYHGPGQLGDDAVGDDQDGRSGQGG